MSDFFQKGPNLNNEFEDDFVLKAFLKARFSEEDYKKIESDLTTFGALVSGPMIKLAEQAERELPVHVPFDPWGKRIDEIRTSSAWKELHAISAREGLVAIGYEREFGSLSRLYQFAKLYLFNPSSAIYSCPLAMADGAARVLENLGSDSPQFTEAFQHLCSRDPLNFWTSGQWMTEKTGGSDVGGTSTVATRFEDHYKLSGIKWFSSATTSEMALGLARIEGDEEGSRGLTLFYIPMRKKNGELNGIEVLRLKDKLGTKALPTAELKLQGAEAWKLSPQGQGVKYVSAMLNITRLYNAICSVSQMRRILSLSLSYSKNRQSFGQMLKEHPLHVQTLSSQFAQWAQATAFVLHLSHLLGKEELKETSPEESQLLRLLTPVAKLWTAKKAMAITSEGIESFGGAGYIEDTGLPVHLRNTQVLSIWEGTTNVLSLDVLRVIKKETRIFESFFADCEQRIQKQKTKMPEAYSWMKKEMDSLSHWIEAMRAEPETVWQASARELAFRLAEIYSRSLIIELCDSKAEEKPWKSLLHELFSEELVSLKLKTEMDLKLASELVF